MKISIERRSSQEVWGRLGGGWQWKVGFQASAGFKTVIISLLIFSITLSFGRK